MQVTVPEEELDSDANGSNLTCISCRMLFNTPKDQREHYKSDLHRFNLKRKVAKLPPVTEAAFNQKVQTLNNESAAKLKASGGSNRNFSCSYCNKQYVSANAYNNHTKSRKHIEKASKGGNQQDTADTTPQPLVLDPSQDFSLEEDIGSKEITRAEQREIEKHLEEQQKPKEIDSQVAETPLTEEEIIEQKIKNARYLTPEECLFCSQKSKDLESNLEHMTTTHGFFIPDIEYLKDLQGLIKYLGEKVSVGNICLYCNGKGRGFSTTEAVQGHMRDCSHCKLQYDDNEEEYGDFYDFSDDWQSVPQEEGQEETSHKPKLHVADNGLELVFEDGRSAGHRSMNVYYRQRFRPPETRESVLINSLMKQYKALGWTEKWHQQTQQQKKEAKMHKMKQQTYDMKLGMRGNWLFRHFKKQTDFA